MGPDVPAPASETAPRARRQLGRVLLWLGLLDVAVLLWVLVVVLAAAGFGWSNVELLVALLVGVGTILGIRIGMAARLRKRAGDLA